MKKVNHNNKNIKHCFYFKKSFNTSFERIVKAVLGISMLVCTAFAQNNPTNVTDGYTPSGIAYGNFSLDGFARVSEFNGSLNFVLPLHTVVGRGETSYTINLRIESPTWVIRHFNFTPPYSTNSPSFHHYIIGSESTPFGKIRKPDFGVGVVAARRSGQLRYGTPYGLPGASPRYCATLSRITFVSSDGNEAQLLDRETNGNPNGVPTINLDDNSIPKNRGRIFDSNDGSNITFVADSDIVDVTCADLAQTGSDHTQYPSGTLYLPNGIKYGVVNGHITSITDRNGNQTQVGNIDSLGRQVNISETETLTTLTSKGFGGADRVIKIHKGIKPLRSDMQPRTTRQLFPGVTGCANGCAITPAADSTFAIGEGVTRIELPNGQSYYFYYNSYGELARVELPTGGAYEYDYQGQFGAWTDAGEVITNYSTSSNTHDWAVSRRVSKQRTYNTNGSLESEVSYTKDPNGSIDVKTRGSNGTLLNNSKMYFQGTPLDSFTSGRTPITYNPQFEGRELKRELYEIDGTLVQTLQNIWEQTGTSLKPENERLKENRLILESADLVSKKEFTYGQFNNLTDTYEYDYGVNAPGNFKRRTHTDFITDLAYTSETGANLKNLPSQIWISSDFNGSSRVSLTKFDYDNYNQDANNSEVKNAALLPRSDVVGHNTVNYGVEKYHRGNTTKVTTYGNAQNQTEAVSVYSNYDILGNVIKSYDGKGYLSTIDYSDRFGAPDGEAQSNSAPAQLNGLNTFAFPTGATNPVQWVAFTQVDYFTGAVVNIEDVNGTVSKNIYNDPLDRPTQSVIAVGTTLERQSSIIYDDANRRIETRSDLNALNDNSLKSETFYDGLGRTVETRNHESDGSFIAVKSIPFEIVQDTETLIWRVGAKVSNPYRSSAGEQPVWTISLRDALGRIIKIITPDDAVIKTEHSGNTVTVTDQALKQRRSITNALGQVIRVDEPNDTGQLDVTGVPAQPTNYQYDPLGNLIHVEQIGTTLEQCGGMTSNCAQTRTFIYDSLSRLRQATNPESGTVLYVYDNNGNLTNRTDARMVATTYTYDALNRVTQRSYNVSTTPTVTFNYDGAANAKGKLTKVTTGNMTSPFSVTEYQVFDKIGRVLQSRQSTEGVAYNPMTYLYNLSGALIEETYPSGRKVKNVLDNNGDLSIVQSKKNANYGFWHYADSFTYTASGAVSSMQLGNFTWESTQFNSRLQPEQIALGSTRFASNILKLHYDYGELQTNGMVNTTKNNGNIAKQTITVPDVQGNNGFTAVQSYTYDTLNRIKIGKENINNNSAPDWKQTFVYDRFGNRYFDEANTTTLPKNCNNNTEVCLNDRKTLNPSVDILNNRFITSDNYIFDNSGNLEKDAQSRKFTYDGENKQIKVETVDSNGNVIATIGEYFYDGEGKRVKKYVPSTGETTIFVYDAANKLVAEYSTIVAQQSEAKVSYLTDDHLGSPRITTDENGRTISRRDFQPFGEIVSTNQRIQALGYSDDNIRQKFTGYEHDGETDLDFSQARYFNPGLGRFSSPDNFSNDTWVTDPQSWNLYTYTRNNPLKYVDPNGEEIRVTIDGATYRYEFRNGAGQFIDQDGNCYSGSNQNVIAALEIFNLAQAKYTKEINRLINGGSHDFYIGFIGDGVSLNLGGGTNFESTDLTQTSSQVVLDTSRVEESVSALGEEAFIADLLQQKKNDPNFPYAYWNGPPSHGRTNEPSLLQNQQWNHDYGHSNAAGLLNLENARRRFRENNSAPPNTASSQEEGRSSAYGTGLGLGSNNPCSTPEVWPCVKRQDGTCIPN